MSKYGFSIIIMVLELGLVFWFFFWLGQWTPTLWIAFVILFSVATILAIVNRSMTPESKVTWLLVAFIPVFGPLLYLMFGERRLSRSELKQLKNMDQMKFREDNSYELRLELKNTDKSAYGIIKSLLSMDHNADVYDGTESQFFPLGEEMFQKMLEDLRKAEKFIFLLLVFSMSMTFLLALFWRGVEELSLRKMQSNLKRLLAGQEVVQVADPDLDASFKSLSGKLNLLTEALQKAENQSLAQEEEIIEKERKRIARDLHDTVSQELFAAHMILSGVSQQTLKLDREKMQTQLQSVTAILETAQKDLRVLLLHLRPVELEQKSLIEGIQILLKELEDKSDLKVSLKQNMTKLPKKIEEHIFRILQELISNTLRHAQASCLDVYLYQTDFELQLKVVDNGVGFQLASVDDLSYGLRNIKERVEDMAGTVQLLTAPKQGLAVDIRIPLLDKEL